MVFRERRWMDVELFCPFVATLPRDTCIDIIRLGAPLADPFSDDGKAGRVVQDMNVHID